MYKICFIILFLCGWQLSANAQTVQGNIMGKDSLPLPGVFIQNIHTKVYSVSNGDGYFSISASPLDTLLFRATGHLPVSFRAISIPGLLYMRPEIIQLAGVEIVRKTYREDSIALREDFSKNFNFRRPKIQEVLVIMPTGIGVNIFQLYKALSFKNNKRQLNFKRRLQEFEQEKYVTQFFTPELVSKYSGLQGDSLQKFMLLHPPTFQFMKDASTYDLLLYVKQAAERFRKG